MGNLVVQHTKEFPCPKNRRHTGMMILVSRGGPLHETAALQRFHTSTTNRSVITTSLTLQFCRNCMNKKAFYHFRQILNRLVQADNDDDDDEVDLDQPEDSTIEVIEHFRDQDEKYMSKTTRHWKTILTDKKQLMKEVVN